MNRHIVISYINHFVKSRYWKGHGIHSPFVFKFVNDVVFSKHLFYHFEALELYRKELLENSGVIDFVELGAGKKGIVTKRVSSIARRSAVSPRYGKLLSRIVNFTKPATILEFGTSLGVGSLYLGLAATSAKLVTMEGNKQCANIAAAALKKYGCVNGQVVVGNFDDVLPGVLTSLGTLGFVWFDGNHTKEATLRYFNMCVDNADNDSVFVFDDIRWSKGMGEAWREIVSHPKVTISIEMFRIGIIFFRKECPKQHFKLRWC